MNRGKQIAFLNTTKAREDTNFPFLLISSPATKSVIIAKIYLKQWNTAYAILCGQQFTIRGVQLQKGLSHDTPHSPHFWSCLSGGRVHEYLHLGRIYYAALLKKNKEFSSVMQVGAEHWKGWTKGLKYYYCDIPQDAILVNHVFTFGDSNPQTIFKRQEYHDVDAKEFDILPTSRSKKNCFGLSANERADDLQNLPDCLNLLPPPGLSADKANNTKSSFARWRQPKK